MWTNCLHMPKNTINIYTYAYALFYIHTEQTLQSRLRAHFGKLEDHRPYENSSYAARAAYRVSLAKMTAVAMKLQEMRETMAKLQ